MIKAADKKSEVIAPVAEKTVPQHVEQVVVVQKDTTLPLIAMLLGVVSLSTFMLFLGIPALVLGLIGLKKYPEARGFSITGIITGALSIFFMVCFVLFFIVLIVGGAFNEANWDSDSTTEPHMYQQDNGREHRYRLNQEGV
jgi:hypothetical protein